MNSKTLSTFNHAFLEERNTYLIKELQVIEPSKEIVYSSYSLGNTFFGNVRYEKIVYLTFDDGPSKNTEVILDILQAEGVLATFFVNGRTGKYERSVYKRIVSEGHTIGNHTYSHNYSEIYKSKKDFLEDFKKLENLLIETVGFAPKLMRFPGGSNNTVSHRVGGRTIMNEIVSTMTELGYIHSDWNVDSTDALVKLQTKKHLIEEVTRHSKGQNELNILFHDSNAKTTTPEALRSIILEFKKQNYRFEKMTENSFFVQFNSALN